MARNDAILAVQQDRIREPEFLDAGSDLADLLLGMGPGIPGEWNQGIERPIFDPETGLGTLFGPVWRHFGGFWRVFGGLRNG